eukprot:13612387-Alexandrium_andersonii.AAC.1
MAVNPVRIFRLRANALTWALRQASPGPPDVHTHTINPGSSGPQPLPGPTHLDLLLLFVVHDRFVVDVVVYRFI